MTATQQIEAEKFEHTGIGEWVVPVSAALMVADELDALKAMIIKSDLIEVDSSRVESDSCGKPIYVKSGKILRHRHHLSEVEQHTKDLQRMASMARKIAALEDKLKAANEELRQSADTQHLPREQERSSTLPP